MGGGVGLVAAITAMNRIGDCGNGYDPPCPPGIENDFYLMGGAILAIAVGSIMTWGVGLGMAIMAAGVAALVYSQTVPADLQAGEFIIAGVCFGLLALGIFVGSAAVRSATAKRRAFEERIAEQARFVQRATVVAGKVVALRDTGTTIDNDPEAAITISYTRSDGTTAQVETIEVVPRLNIPRPGDAATVWYDAVTGEAIGRLGSPQTHSGTATFPETPHIS
ncbi:hypothetical protein AWC19_13465 [Mycobacterium palustre]|uniref:DUF3592 domain-containing protein n=1 Tax=Mycobacterium palustre TaxID=153971 RepID=A0A1X1ZF36_9MYCO|nr:hypothetical protein AWC19_13465 [Mycobacterium palustre]